jgi:hypothetical protein
MNAAPFKWTCELRITNGHRYFKDAVSGRIAVADNSGDLPDRTDDGVLWLVPEGPVTLDLKKGHVYGWIPVTKDPDGGDTYSVSEYAVDAMRVAETFGLQVDFSDDMAKFVDAYEKYKARTTLAVK